MFTFKRESTGLFTSCVCVCVHILCLMSLLLSCVYFLEESFQSIYILCFCLQFMFALATVVVCLLSRAVRLFTVFRTAPFGGQCEGVLLLKYEHLNLVITRTWWLDILDITDIS